DKSDSKKHDEKDKRDDKGKSPVDSPTGVRDLKAEFEEFSSNSTNRVNVISAPVNAAGLNPTNSTNSFNTASPSINVVNMPELEDIVSSDDEEDVGAEADLSNLEINIPDNCEALKKCLEEGPYVPSTVIIPAKPATETSKAVEEHSEIETLANMFDANKAYFKAEKEAIHMLLTRIGDEIYSTIDACNTAHEIWIAIKRLQQGKSLNVQEVKTNLFWEFGKFTSRDGDSMESYYARFYKMMNEMIRNNLHVDTMQAVSSAETGIQCFNCKEFDHFTKECRKPKRVKDYTYHKEKMLMCKQVEEGSLGVEGPPMMPEDPYAYVVAAFQSPPSPDYVHGPKEPEQTPPLPEFVPEPVYPEFMPL
nr:hypothetical protein [Tanacetum cinerariifolium]